MGPDALNKYCELDKTKCGVIAKVVELNYIFFIHSFIIVAELHEYGKFILQMD
jgi:hypothetical protein